MSEAFRSSLSEPLPWLEEAPCLKRATYTGRVYPILLPFESLKRAVFCQTDEYLSAQRISLCTNLTSLALIPLSETFNFSQIPHIRHATLRRLQISDATFLSRLTAPNLKKLSFYTILYVNLEYYPHQFPILEAFFGKVWVSAGNAGNG
jgi:hypothetical protein